MRALCDAEAAAFGIIGFFLVTASTYLTPVSGLVADVISHCCELGRTWTVQSQELCGPYPESYITTMLERPDETLACTALVDACCVQARREKQCSAGRETAVVLGRCDELHHYQANEDAKECCNCCQFGMITSQVGHACHVPVELRSSPMCVEAFTDCCLAQSPVLPDDEASGRLSPQPNIPAFIPLPQQREHLHLLLPLITTPATAAATVTSIANPGFDMCQEFEGELCAHICVSTADSYYCTCREGFVLQSDEKSCRQSFNDSAVNGNKTQDSCLSGRHTCNANQRCVKTRDGFLCQEEEEEEGKVEAEEEMVERSSAFPKKTTPVPVTPRGKCSEGYAWNRSTRQCEDIDECILDQHDCETSQSCMNTDGHFRCLTEVDDRDIYDEDYYPETDAPNERSLTHAQQNTPTAPRARFTTPSTVITSRMGSERPIFRPFFTHRPAPTLPSIARRPATNATLTQATTGRTEEDVQCLAGYVLDLTKTHCEDVDECSSGDAHGCHLPNQVCINSIGSFRCQCEAGYVFNPSSNFCEDVDECTATSLCAGEQTCENTLGSFQCTCASGFTLDHRTQQCKDINECRSIPNVCSATEICENVIGSYRCSRKAATCATGYELEPYGTRCIDIDECSTTSPCAGGQLCQNTPGSFRCSCEAGFTLDSRTQQCTDIDECQMRQFTCLGGQTCVNTPGSFACRCNAGFIMDTRTKTCIDVDECERALHTCSKDEVCENTQGSFSCTPKTATCQAGFSPAGKQCVDIDECRLNTHNCGVARVCQNTPGSFRCLLKQCPRGYRLDQETGRCNPVVCARGMRPDHAGTCIDINECVERPNICRPHQECRNTIGSFQCHTTMTCGTGYELHEETGRCDDIDECQRGTHRCQGAVVQCINRPGTYLCQCPDGYHLDHQRQSCEDVDECRLYGGQTCSQNADCENTPGSFRCICKDGFELTADNRSCRDIDECQQPRLCQHSCQNTWGSFKCSCNNGYQLSSHDGRTCLDIDECTVWSQRGTVLCQGICENTPGSYKCTCPSGYHLAADGRICRDVDECAGVNANCNGPDDVCINTRGGYKCENILCPKGFNKVPNSSRNSHAIRCQRRSFTCPQGDVECLYAPISYSVNFIAIPGKLIRVPTDLFTMRGPAVTNRRLQFELKVVSSQDPRTGAVRANRAFFNLNQARANEVVVQLIHEIHGAQDIQLQLNMNVYSREFKDNSDEVFYGTAVAKIIIYITEDPW